VRRRLALCRLYPVEAHRCLGRARQRSATSRRTLSLVGSRITPAAPPRADLGRSVPPTISLDVPQAAAVLVPKLRLVGSGIEDLSLSVCRLAMGPDSFRIEITQWPGLLLEMTESVDAANQRCAVHLSDGLFHTGCD